MLSDRLSIGGSIPYRRLTVLRNDIFVTLFATLILLALALGLNGCGGGGAGVVRSLSGTVLDDGTLIPISGAQVRANTGQSSQTNTSGQFFLKDLGSQANSLTIARTDYQTTAVPIPAGSSSVGTIYLSPAILTGRGIISGRVTQAGVGAGGATLQAGGRQAESKPDGSYSIYNVPAGTQTVVALSADGEMSGSATVNVISQATVTANVSLTNSPPPPPPL